MASTSASSGIQPHNLGTNDQPPTQLSRQGLGTQAQDSPAKGFPQPAGGFQSMAQEGWWIAFLTCIMSLYYAIFGGRKRDSSERSTSFLPQALPANYTNYGSYNKNVGNINNSNNTTTTTIHGPVGASGDNATITNPQFNYGVSPRP